VRLRSDLLFLSPKEGDDKLRATIAKYRDRLVLASNFPMMAAVDAPGGRSCRRDFSRKRVRLVNFWTDIDGVVRETHAPSPETGVRAAIGDHGPVISFAAKAAIAGPDARTHQLRRTERHLSFTSILRAVLQQGLGGEISSAAIFRDKIVLIGPTSDFNTINTPAIWDDGWCRNYMQCDRDIVERNAPRDAAFGWAFSLFWCWHFATAALLTGRAIH